MQSVEYLIVSPGSRDYRDYLAFRHAVFCEELKRISTPEGCKVETDDFDVHSLHIFCRARDTGEALACSRLILPGPGGLNVTARYALELRGDVPVGRVGEIGRLTLAPALRRLRNAELIMHQGGATATGEETIRLDLGHFRRQGALIALGLYRQIFQLMGCYGISHCFAAMEPSLARLYRRLGFPFTPAGPIRNDVSPARQPYLISLLEARRILAGRNANLYEFITGVDELFGATNAARGEMSLSMRGVPNPLRFSVRSAI